jgi:hypothetical protein
MDVTFVYVAVLAVDSVCNLVNQIGEHAMQI